MKKIKFLLLIVTLSYTSIYAQKDSIIVFESNDIKTIQIPIIIDPVIYNDTCTSCRMPYGISRNLNINYSEWSFVDSDSGKVWGIQLISPKAKYLDIIFSQFVIPNGYKLFVYTSDSLKPLFSLDNKYSKPMDIYKAITVKGDRAIIKYFEPKDVTDNGAITISSVVHIFKDIFTLDTLLLKSLACEIDVNCNQGDPYRDIIRSIVYIRNIKSDHWCDLSPAGVYSCSGVLINNTINDFTPYILTAQHCICEAENNLDEIVFHFNYQSSTCDGSSPYGNGPYDITGAELKAQRNPTMGSDFALLKLSETPPLQYNVYYAGWSREWGLTGSDVVAIHHPDADPKKISFGHVQGISAGDYLNVKWDEGTVEGISSGSPIFKNNQVVGQLSGGLGNNNCSHLGDDLYGHFASSWGSTWGPDRRLRDWLDPSESNPDSWNGADPRNECTPDLYLSGVYPRTDYQSESIVIQATNTINISNMDVQENGNYIFKAGNSIHITAGTTLHSGTYKIENSSCPLSVGISGPSKGNNNTIYTWTAHVSNGTLPYTYEWSYSYDEINYTDFMGNTSSITAPLPIDMDLYLKVTVSSSDGQIASGYFLTINLDAYTNKSINPNDTLSDNINNTLKKNTLEYNKINFTSKSISILPNPTSGFITVSYNQALPFIVEVTNTIGKNIYRSEFSTGSVIIDFTNQPKGLYFIKVSNTNSLLKVDKIICQ